MLPTNLSSSHNKPNQDSKHVKKSLQKQRRSYKGITLKEYFRICDQVNDTIKEIKQQSRPSSKSSLANTPGFVQQPTNRKKNVKVKTQIGEQYADIHFKSKHYPIAIDLSTRILADLQPSRQNNPFRKKDDRKKIYNKIHSESTKYNDLLNRSTLNGFRQMEDGRRKMLRKLQADKERAKDLRLSEAFFITKYGQRFMVDAKNLPKN